MKELRKDSVVRGHHVYKTVWTPVIGGELNLEREESNEHDEYEKEWRNCWTANSTAPNFKATSKRPTLRFATVLAMTSRRPRGDSLGHAQVYPAFILPTFSRHPRPKTFRLNPKDRRPDA